MLPTSGAIGNALLKARAAADRRHAQVVHYKDINRAEREILIKTGWLQEIIRGWYMLVRPDVASGDTAAWYANFWDFVRVYLQERFGENYCLSAESSLDLHMDNPSVPKQVIVIVKQGTGLRELMYDTSLMLYADKKNFPMEVTQKNGIQVMQLEYAICKVSPTFFQQYPREAELALRSIKSANDLTRILIRYQLKTAAARLVGAYQFLNDKEMALTLQQNLNLVGLLVNPVNPFLQTVPLLTKTKLTSPCAGRIRAMWVQSRETIIKHFPKPLGLPKNPDNYLKQIDHIYQFDAYNSLSIEGYQVSDELIQRVKSKSWNPSINLDDYHLRNAMAAKGYYDAFQAVKKDIGQIIRGKNAADIVSKQLQLWYQQLFSPNVKAGLLSPEALFGFRNERVFIRNSRHAPPPKEAVADAMNAFFDCLKDETHPAVNAILGHYLFVYIHPYMDGNGRIARFLMNAFLASGGYPWTVVRVDNREEYISILENTHTKFDLTAFTLFIKQEMKGE